MASGQQVFHIARQYKQLQQRYAFLRLIREFFWAQHMTEVDVPLIVAHPGQEPNIENMCVSVVDDRGFEHEGFLHTSPEYSMKKMLAAGCGDIFYLGKAFRNNESFGGLHNPEFTLAEWYRVGGTLDTIMDDVENLYTFLYAKSGSGGQKKHPQRSIRRVTMQELWIETVGIDLSACEDVVIFGEIARSKGYRVLEGDRYEEIFYRIFLDSIEPTLKDAGIVMIMDYPKQMASLARLNDTGRYARRVEVYIDGIEIANGFEELTDPVEQENRFVIEQSERKKQGKSVYPIDRELIVALEQMPETSGIALGVDRLIMLLIGCQKIDDVLAFPMKKLFS